MSKSTSKKQQGGSWLVMFRTLLSGQKGKQTQCLQLFQSIRENMGQWAAAHNLECRLPGERLDVGAVASEPDSSYFVVASSSWALFIKASRDSVELYLTPSVELARGPSVSMRRLLLKPGKGDRWEVDNIPVEDADVLVLAKNEFKALCRKTKAENEAAPPGSQAPDDSLAAYFSFAVSEKNRLLQVIVNQQEETQNRIAREIHDAVIGDLMTLQRSIAAGKQFDPKTLTDSIKAITERLREICSELTPRDLSAWGLDAVLRDLLDGFSKQAGINTSYALQGQLPPFSDELNLQIYRIVQECLNNASKYSQATEVCLNLRAAANAFNLEFKDNGVGFDAAGKADTRTRAGGSGSFILRERAQLINCYYPTQLKVTSQPGQGTTIVLEIDTSGGLQPAAD